MTKRAWCFTLNNFTVEEYDEISEWMEDETLYCVLGIEFGEQNQNPHIQGYFRCKNAMRLAGCKKLPGLSRAHFEFRRGTEKEAADYCKKDGDWVQFGKPTKCPGERTDVTAFQERLASGATDMELMDLALEKLDEHTIFSQIYGLSQLEKISGAMGIPVNERYLWMTSPDRCASMTSLDYWTGTPSKFPRKEASIGGAPIGLLSQPISIRDSGIVGKNGLIKSLPLDAGFITFGTLTIGPIQMKRPVPRLCLKETTGPLLMQTMEDLI